MATWQEKLAADEIVLIDGGMGTELERVGAQMNANGWSGAALIEVPDVVRRVHREFVEAGAEVITVTTFSMAPHMLRGMGYGDRVEQAIGAPASTMLGRTHEAIAGIEPTEDGHGHLDDLRAHRAFQGFEYGFRRPSGELG